MKKKLVQEGVVLKLIFLYLSCKFYFRLFRSFEINETILYNKTEKNLKISFIHTHYESVRYVRMLSYKLKTCHLNLFFVFYYNFSYDDDL